jgi:hypothetical protein
MLLLVGLAAVGVARADDPQARKPLSGDPTATIDRMVQEAWDAAGIKPSPLALDGEFVRRAYLDLLGRIPTVEEAGEFLASKDEQKRARLIAELLEHPDYPKHMATLWRVVLIGRKRQDREVDRGALETWLRKQFAENRPWNEVARELVTATGSNRENGAVNYLLAHLGDRERDGTYSAVNLTSTTTRALLGQQIQCTQCHDHPSNDWKQADFWGINAFFKGVRTEDYRRTNATGAEVYDRTEVTDEPTDAYSTFEKRNAIVGIAFPTFLDGRKISQGTDAERRKALGDFITEANNLQFARAHVNRIWGQLMGRGIVHPVDDFGDHNPASLPELLDALAEGFRASGYDTKKLITWIANSRPYQLTSVMTKGNEKDETLFSHMLVKPLTPEQLFDSLLTATAAHKAGGDADRDRRRGQWLDQFVFAFGNDEGEEGTFQGTIPQALMMMNGELMERATGGEPGSFLARLRNAAMNRRQGQPETYMVNMIYLSALSRYPTNPELRRAQGFLASSPDTLGVLSDLFWALLNSNEFILNH